MTAAIGIVIGVGFYEAALYSTIITVVILSIFRWVESKIPSMKYARLSVRFLCSDQYADEDSLRGLIKEHDIRSYETSYKLSENGKAFTYNITLRTNDMKNYRLLAQSLMNMEDVHEFRITPSS